MDKPSALIPDRFWSKVDAPSVDECWLWMAARSWGGYGAFWVDNGARRAHRWLYELLVGPIPDGLTLDHLCVNPPCVNPGHLEPVTAGANALRGDGPPAQNARRTHCIRDHEFTEENTVVQADGHRRCRTCRANYNRQRWASQEPAYT